ncbi:hypothetical protein BGZ54_000640, partial [Gamsiella multidivaricata]
MPEHLKLFCLVSGDSVSRVFPVKVPSDDTVSDLKELIKAKKAPELDDIAADNLTLWHVSIPLTDGDDEHPVILDTLNDKKKLRPATDLSEVFSEEIPRKTVNILVQRPQPVEKWQELIEKTEGDFFTPGSIKYTVLVRFVKGDAKLPTTEGILGGLPCIYPRAGMKANRLSLLFLNLPESSETQEPPSTAGKALVRIHGRAIPLLSFFGVTGCGKTRTAIEMLCKQWGFYFYGSRSDWGSSDLYKLLKLVRTRDRYKTFSVESNTHVHVLALALILARLMTLHHCLDISERENVRFTCKRWMLLQVSFQSMDIGDVFTSLFELIASHIRNHYVDHGFMATLVRERFSELRQRLVNYTPNKTFRDSAYKILIIVDEAQELSKEIFGTYLSGHAPSGFAPKSAAIAAQEDYKRPVLSPFTHGLYQTASDESQICVIPCGTGLSIFDMKWLDGSAPGPKGYVDQLGPFTDFVGWESLEQVRDYRDLVRSALPNQEARIIFDAQVPETSMQELFDSFRGRFRPIVSTIERMIILKPGISGIDWKSAIKETEDT